MECQDFDENLIECVRNNKCFYHKKNVGYKNPLLKERVWEEIASQLNSTVDHCKARWKSLRDRYVRERKKMKSLPYDEHQPTWPLYESMDFLTDFINDRRRGGSNCNEDSHDDESIINFKDEENSTSTFSITFPEVLPKQERITPVPVEISVSNPSPPMPAPMVPNSPPAKKKKTNMLDEMDNNFMQTLSSLKEYLVESIEGEDRDVKNFSATVSRLYQELDEPHRKTAKAHVIKYLGDMISNQLLNT